MRKRRRASRPERVEVSGITGHLLDAARIPCTLAWASLQVYCWVFPQRLMSMVIPLCR